VLVRPRTATSFGPIGDSLGTSGLAVSTPGSTSATGASLGIGTSGLAVATPGSTSAVGASLGIETSGLAVSMPGSTSATGASLGIGTSGLAVATPSSTSAPLLTHPCSMPAQAIPPVTPTVAARDVTGAALISTNESIATEVRR